MKYSIAAELLLAGYALALPEITFQKRDKHTNGQTQNVARGAVRKRDVLTQRDTLETTLWSGVGYVSGGAYYANITVGTPPQLQIVLLDTGSSDLYLDARSSDACQSNGPHSCIAGSFVPGKSSSYELVAQSPAFNATYGDGSTAIGPYVQDTVCVNNICLDNVQFGLAEDVESTVGPTIGIFGVGYSYGEAVSQSQYFYPNYPDALAAAGVINSRLYSLYLNDYEALTGSILFGGVDTAKYTGPLQTVDILPEVQTGFVDRFITTVTGLKTTSGGNTRTLFSGGASGVDAYRVNSGSLPVLLDSGSSAWSVLPEVYSAIVSQFNYIDPKTGLTSCKNIENNDDHITVTFDGKIDIDVPITEWVTPVYDTKTGDREKLTNGEDACLMFIVPSQGTGLGFDTMGDAVMRSMYIVYDLDNGQMSLAQAKTDTTSSNVKAVPAGPGGVAKVANNAKSVAPNSYSIVPSVSATVNYDVSTAKTAVGTATGEAALPNNAQFEGAGGSDSGGGSGSGASALLALDGSGLWLTAGAALSVVLGAGLIL